jgi:hypothetical protein
LKLETNTRLAGALIFKMRMEIIAKLRTRMVIAKLGTRVRMEMFATSPTNTILMLISDETTGYRVVIVYAA